MAGIHSSRFGIITASWLAMVSLTVMPPQLKAIEKIVRPDPPPSAPPVTTSQVPKPTTKPPVKTTKTATKSSTTQTAPRRPKYTPPVTLAGSWKGSFRDNDSPDDSPVVTDYRVEVDPALSSIKVSIEKSTAPEGLPVQGVIAYMYPTTGGEWIAATYDSTTKTLRAQTTETKGEKRSTFTIEKTLTLALQSSGRPLFTYATSVYPEGSPQRAGGRSGSGTLTRAR